MGLDRRGCGVQPRPLANWYQEEPLGEVKPFDISKREVWEAFTRFVVTRKADFSRRPPRVETTLQYIVSPALYSGA